MVSLLDETNKFTLLIFRFMMDYKESFGKRQWHPTPVGGAWWAAIYGVAQSQTRLKWRSSSIMNRLDSTDCLGCASR